MVPGLDPARDIDNQVSSFLSSICRDIPSIRSKSVLFTLLNKLQAKLEYREEGRLLKNQKRVPSFLPGRPLQ